MQRHRGTDYSAAHCGRRRGPGDPELAKSVDAYVAPYVAFHAFSGVILVAKGDAILLEKAWGMANYELGVPNTPDTRFRIASITKRFTQIVVTRLVEEKKLSLADPLSKFAPTFPKADAITIDQLVNHRSGIRDPDKLRRVIAASYTPAEVVDLLAREPLGSEPGKTYSYTTANYAVLAFVIEKVTGRTFAKSCASTSTSRQGWRTRATSARSASCRGSPAATCPTRTRTAAWR